MVKVDAPRATIGLVADHRAPRVALDATDLALLRLLASNVRLSRRKFAQELHISAPTVGERIARLERKGVIRSYSVDIDWNAVGYGLKVFLSVTAADGFDIGEIMAGLWKIAEVEDVTLVTGNFDMLVRLRVRDADHLRTLLMGDIWMIPGLARTETLIGIAEMPPKPFTTGLIDAIRALSETVEDVVEP